MTTAVVVVGLVIVLLCAVQPWLTDVDAGPGNDHHAGGAPVPRHPSRPVQACPGLALDLR